MNELPTQKVLAIPEIVYIIVSMLDPDSLKTATLVCRNWHHHCIQILWRQLVIPKDWFNLDLSLLWPVLDRRGSLLKALALEISPSTRMIPELDQDLIERQLSSILSRCPNLERLQVQVPREIKSQVITLTISAHSHKLKQLDTDILNWEPEDLNALLIACPDLHQLAGHNFTGDILQVIARAQPKMDMIDCTHARFDDEELVEFAKALPNLRQLSVTMHQFLTAKALIGVSAHCWKLEHLNFHFCLSLKSSGFQALLRVSPHLRTLDLGLTEVHDADITLVAGLCPQLESLKLPFCSNITKVSIGAVVQSCPQLLHLDLSFCDGVLLSIFENPTTQPWVCHQLRYLDISGIHASYSVEASMASSLLPSMYHQISLLKRLEFLRMTAHGFSLQLLEVGEPFLKELKNLETLDLTKLKHPLPWKDMVTIGNLFPKLKKFEFRSSDVIPPMSIKEQKAILKAMEDHAGVRPLFSEFPGVHLGKRKSRETHGDDNDGDHEESGRLDAGNDSDTYKENTQDTLAAEPRSAKRRRSQSPPVGAEPTTEHNLTDPRTLHGPVKPALEENRGSGGEDDSEPLPEIMKATLRSGLEISFRLSGEDDQDGEGGEEGGWGFLGGMPAFG
ncbi:hypothetical protein EMPS_11089 [Entomortierella parvispora]|uniref:F-box domain-containing protein n=1 Tax=Entomortierella parvispora TaxID=205924 RepID=A0A9P3M257_9FUNG|nr:hypothetical protein EMPS_11089 [Entomortierella parvispora]